MTATAVPDTALLVRDTAGLHVEIHHLASVDALVLQCEVNGQWVTAPVPSSRALDAFDHPVVYLSDEQIDTLFPRTPSAV